MSKTQYQHYVPRFYLKGFLVPEQTGRKPPQNLIWVYRVHEQPLLAPLSKVGGEPDFYQHEQGGNLESSLQKIEQRAARLLPKLVKDRRLVGSDRSDFALFIGLTTSRGRAFFDMTQQSINKAETYIESLAASAKEGQALSERIYKSVSVPWGALTKQWTLNEMIECGKVFATLAEKMRWWIVKTRDDDDYFITSDTPVSFTDPNNVELSSGYITFSAQAEFTFPLDRRHMLCGLPRKQDGFVLERPHVIRQLNRRTIRRAYREVYAPAKEENLQMLVSTMVPVAGGKLINETKLYRDVETVISFLG